MWVFSFLLKSTSIVLNQAPRLGTVRWVSSLQQQYQYHRFLLASTSRPQLPLWSSSSVKFFSSDTANGLLQWEGAPKFEVDKSSEDKNKRRNKPRAKLLIGKIKKKNNKKKIKFPNAEARIKFKIEKAKRKEALLIEAIKRYEIPKAPGPEPERLTASERFYLKRMGQKHKNYVPVGRRGIFGGVILNMHLHWKKHETVQVICKHCKPGQIHEYAEEIARLSGGIAIHIQHDTILFYRGKNYTQPKVMQPKDTLSKRKALKKSKFVQSLDSVRRFIAISEKELEIYYRHIALYGKSSKEQGDETLSNEQQVVTSGHLLENENSTEQSSCSAIPLSDSSEETHDFVQGSDRCS